MTDLSNLAPALFAVGILTAIVGTIALTLISSGAYLTLAAITWACIALSFLISSITTEPPTQTAGDAPDCTCPCVCDTSDDEGGDD